MRTQASLGLAGLGLSLIVLLSGVSAAQAARDSDRQGWLGIFTQSLTSELREGLDYRGGGVLVNRVVADSPADHAGIEKGDVIVSVNMRSVDSPEQLADVIGNHHPGDDVALRVVRNGERRTLDVTLAARDETSDTPAPDTDKSFDKSLDKEIDKDKEQVAPPAPEAPEAPPVPVPDRGDIRRMIRDSQGHMRMFGLAGRGRLGVRVQDIDEDQRGSQDVDKGAVVSEVLPDSPAERAGLKEGDIITEIDGTAIENSGDLVDAVRGKEGRVNLEYYRRGARHTVQVLLERPGNSGGPRVYSWQGDDGRAPMVREFDSRTNDDLRKQIDDLREELRQLRRELEDLKRNNR